MKKIIVLSVFSMVSMSQAKEIEPNVYNTISEEAQEESIKFDGMRILGGLSYSQHKINAGSKSHKMNVIGGTVGGEYGKTFKKNWLVAVDVMLNLSQKKKQEGSWKDVDPSYEDARGALWAGNRTATLETSPFSADIAVKGGYQLKSYSSLIFAKLGIAIFPVKATCKYKVNGNEIGKVDMKWHSPMISLGVERKFNSKWGGVIEAGMGLEKKSTKSFDNFNHEMKLKRINVSVMGTYTVK